MGPTHEALLELQQIDDEIAKAESRAGSFEERFGAVEAPLRTLENEVDALRARVDELKQHILKLETGAQNKRERQHAYEQRVERTKSRMEEAAARAEIDLIRRATEADVAEARDVGQELTRAELRLGDLEKQVEKVRDEVRPKREELQQESDAAESELSQLRDRRAARVSDIDKAALTLYERVRGRKGRRALAAMTPEGACGNCFNMLPLQEQTEIKSADGMRRCEACGVILYAQE
ncbi:MAG: zinc ribbon domain-containing protein [Longimicrobiales bacterium]